jgi:hypothetical protein
MSNGSEVGTWNIEPVLDAPRLGSLVSGIALPGEKVMISWPAGHLVAVHAGAENVFPFAHLDSVILERQIDTLFERMRTERVTKYFGPAPPELLDRIRSEGYPVTFYYGP